MLSLFNALPPITQSLLILIVVALIKLIVGVFSKSDRQQSSFTFFRFYCQQLSNKVNKEKNSHNQRKIAGAIALFITLAPLIVILWLFEAFIAVPLVWDALLLFLAFGSFNSNTVGKKIVKLLTENNKQLAKQTLTPWLFRDCEKMSPMGISKATIEMLLLRTVQQYFVVGFIFILLGPLAAISYRLILEAHYSWNIKATKYEHFGLATHKLTNLIQWLPTRIFYCLMLFTSFGNVAPHKAQKTQPSFFQLNNNLLLNKLACFLNVSLGGVAMYEGKKLRRQSFNDSGADPSEKSISQAMKYLNLTMSFALAIIISLIAIIAILVTN